MKEFRKQFPVLTHSIYANTATSGLMSRGLQEWRQEHDLDFLTGGSTMKMESSGLIPQTRQTIGNFFGCSEERVALVQNFTLGINILLEGLDKTSKVLLLENDYPSLNWPFEKRGFPITYVPIDVDLEQHIWEKVETENPEVLALSLVQWLNGIKVDMDFLKKLKDSFPGLLIIADGTQFCGAFDIDFEESAIDVLGASGYKWLLAGYGNGFMLFDEKIQRRLKLNTIGFNSAGINTEAKDTFRFAKHFEPGHLDTLNFGSLNCSIKLLANIGIQNIEAHNKTLKDKAQRELTALGLLNDAIVRRKEHSTIFNINGNEEVYRHLEANKVICSQRGGGIRLSFHYYNSENDIDTIVASLKSGM